MIVRGLGLPIRADLAEKTMLNRIPFRCSGRVVGHRNGHSPEIGYLLQLPLPSPDAWVVAATAVRFHKPMLRLRITPPTVLPPPPAQRVGPETTCLVRVSHPA